MWTSSLFCKQKQKPHTYSNALAVEVYGQSVPAGLKQAASCLCEQLETGAKSACTFFALMIVWICSEMTIVLTIH